MINENDPASGLFYQPIADAERVLDETQTFGDPEYEEFDVSTIVGSADSGEPEIEEDEPNWEQKFAQGMKFQSVPEFRQAVQEYGLTRRFVPIYKSNKARWFSLTCVHIGCPWLLTASHSKMDGRVTVIKVRMHKHSTTHRLEYKPRVPSKYLGMYYRTRIRNEPQKWKPRDIMTNMTTQFDVTVPYHVAWRALESANHSIQGKPSVRRLSLGPVDV